MNICIYIVSHSIMVGVITLIEFLFYLHDTVRLVLLLFLRMRLFCFLLLLVLAL
jgi:hypothetical protein